MRALLVMASLALIIAGPVYAQGAENGEATISVTGVATVTVEPDLLVVELGVQNRNDTAVDALMSNAESMTATIAALKSAGISEDEIGTHGFTIRPIQEHDPQTGESYQTGYMVTNRVLVTTNQTDMAAGIIDGGIAAGANRVDRVHFALSEERRGPVSDMLIAEAILDAKSKAEAALLPLEHTITGIKSVSLYEPGSGGGPSLSHDAFSVAYARSTPILASAEQVTSVANVVFLIGP